MTPTQSEKHFRTLLQTQSQLVALSVDVANIRAKLISIQTTLTPHMDILHKELGSIETLMKKDPNISTSDGLVHLVAKLAIQIKSLEVACDNWDISLKIILQFHKSFLDKNTIDVYPIDISVKKGEKVSLSKGRERVLS